MKNATAEHFLKFRDDGIYEANVEAASSENPVFVSQKLCFGKPLLCNNCNRFISRKGFYKHRKACKVDKISDEVKPAGCSMYSLGKEDVTFRDLVAGIQEDAAGSLCKCDPTIQLVGKRLFQKDKSKPGKSMEVKKMVRANMRMLARLYIIFQEHVGDLQDLTVRDMFDRTHFNVLREAVTIFTTKESPEGECDVKYGLKSNLYYVLLSAATFIKGSLLEVKGKEADADEMQRFIEVLKMNQMLLFGDAQYHINMSRQERLRLPERMPNEDDLHALKTANVSTIENIMHEYHFMDMHDFVKLRNAVCCRLTLFNGRRGGEPSRLTMRQWIERSKWIEGVPLKSLDAFEQKLVESMQIMYGPGKANHLVPCLVPNDCKAALDVLCNMQIREDVGLNRHNTFVFANTENSLEHVAGNDAVNYMCNVAMIKSDQITATANRGRVSTLYALLDLPADQRQLFYKHMGHSEKVNIGTYQRPLPIQEIVKVGRHLQTFDGHIEGNL